MYSKQYAPCMRPTFSILMENPSFLHGVHVFSMKFHDFSMGNPWYISVRDRSRHGTFSTKLRIPLNIFAISEVAMDIRNKRYYIEKLQIFMQKTEFVYKC